LIAHFVYILSDLSPFLAINNDDKREFTLKL